MSSLSNLDVTETSPQIWTKHLGRSPKAKWPPSLFQKELSLDLEINPYSLSCMVSCLVLMVKCAP